MDGADLTWDAGAQKAGFSLPARFFYDRDIFERECTDIFYKSWQLVAHINELDGPGAFVTLDIIDQSVIVVRGADGVIRAFHNVCRHRGNRLTEERRGVSSAFVCGYHAWTYGTDGALRGAPKTDAIPGFDRSCFGLVPVRVEVFASFIFVNLDDGAKPITEMAPGAEVLIRSHMPDLDTLELIEEVDVPVAANWKVIQENSIEGYHFEYSGPEHKQLAKLIDFSGYRLTPHGEWWTYIGPPKPGTTEAYGVPLEGATWQTDGFFNFGLWPNATLYVFPYADMVGTFIMTPTGPETSTLRFGYYGPKGRAQSEVTKACVRWMNEDLGPEDIRLNVTTQKGLRSLGYQHGVYLIGDGVTNRSELLVRHFHHLCHRAINGSSGA